MARKAFRGTLAFGLAFVLLGGIGCSSKTSRHTGPGRVYDAQNKFSFVPPAGWRNGVPSEDAFLTFLGPIENGLQINANVSVFAREGTQIEELSAMIKAEHAEMFTNWEVVEEGFVTIDGRKCYSIVFRLDQGTIRVQVVQYFLLAGDKAYLMTFGATADTFDAHSAEFEQSALTARAG